MKISEHWQSKQNGTDYRWGSLYVSNETTGASVVLSVSGSGFYVTVPALAGQTNSIVAAIRDAAFFRSSALRCGVPLRTENTGLESGATPMCRALAPTPHSAVTNTTIRNQQSEIGNRYMFHGREYDSPEDIRQTITITAVPE